MKTEILFILDRSGSMQSCASDAVGGFNTFLAEQRKEPKGKRLTLLQFDHEVQKPYESAKLKDCADLVLGETYKPRGTTALLDAIGTGIRDLKQSEKGIVAIYTDGYENASKEWTGQAVKALLKEVEDKGWEVLFLSAGLDTRFATQTLGMRPDRVMGGAAVAKSFGAVSARATNYANTGVASNVNLKTDYDKTG